MTNNEKRGKFLAELRLKKGLKQTDLAKLINYSDKSISKWERGISFPSNHNVINKLSKIYDVSIDEILNGEYDNLHRCEIRIANAENDNIKNDDIKKHSFTFPIKLFLFFIILLNIYFFNFNGNFLFNVLRKVDIHYNKKPESNISMLSKNYKSNLNEYFVSSIPYFCSKNKCKVFDSDNIKTGKKYKNIINKDSSKSLKNSQFNVKREFNFGDYGFIHDKFAYKKLMRKNVEIYYNESNNLFKIYYKIDDKNLILVSSSFDSNNYIIEVYNNNKNINAFSLNILKFKNCDFEECYGYKDYIMYVNYLKNVKNGA